MGPRAVQRSIHQHLDLHGKSDTTEQAFLVDATPLGGFSLTSGEAVV